MTKICFICRSRKQNLINSIDQLSFININGMKRQKDMTLKEELPRLEGANMLLEKRNSSRRNEEAEPKQKQCPVVDVSGGESKIRCCTEQYCIGTWNVRSMNQDKFEVVKQEMARMHIDISGISKLK